MKSKSWIAAIALLSALPLLADTKGVGGPPGAPPSGGEEAQVPAGQSPAPKGGGEVPVPEEVAKKLESLGESVTGLKKVVDALSKMKLSGYLQAQYVHDESSENELSSPTTTRNRDQFSVRRARVKFTYRASPTARFVLQPEVTSSGVTLKDGYVELTEPWTRWKHTLTAGQFNWPFGFEIMYSSSSREVPERSRVVRALFPGERDRGLMLSGSGFAQRVNYRLAVVNGTGTVQSFDFNKRKDIVGRVGYTFGALDLGASLYRGEDLVATSTNPRGMEFDKRRAGLDFQWTTPIRGLGLRGEYIRGRQAPASGTSRTDSHDVAGWYVYLIQNVGKRHQFVVRADQYDADTDVSGNAVRTINPAYTFHWDDHSKAVLSYELVDTETNDPADDLFTLRYQYSF